MKKKTYIKHLDYSPSLLLSFKVFSKNTPSFILILSTSTLALYIHMSINMYNFPAQKRLYLSQNKYIWNRQQFIRIFT